MVLPGANTARQVGVLGCGPRAHDGPAGITPSALMLWSLSQPDAGVASVNVKKRPRVGEDKGRWAY